MTPPPTLSPLITPPTGPAFPFMGNKNVRLSGLSKINKRKGPGQARPGPPLMFFQNTPKIESQHPRDRSRKKKEQSPCHQWPHAPIIMLQKIKNMVLLWRRIKKGVLEIVLEASTLQNLLIISRDILPKLIDS